MGAVPLLMLYGPKVLGVITGLLCFAVGIVSFISVTPLCILSGFVLVVTGILVIMLEVPACFTLIPPLRRFAQFTEKNPALYKAIFYAVMAVLHISLCFSFSALFSFFALFGCAVLNAYQYYLQRRASGVDATATAYPETLGPPSAGTGQYPEAGQAVLTSGGYRPLGDQIAERAAVGAVHGVLHSGGGIGGGGGGGGGYPGF